MSGINPINRAFVLGQGLVGVGGGAIGGGIAC